MIFYECPSLNFLIRLGWFQHGSQWWRVTSDSYGWALHHFPATTPKERLRLRPTVLPPAAGDEAGMPIPLIGSDTNLYTYATRVGVSDTIRKDIGLTANDWFQ